nr:MAG TPA: hypothetical protein [Bacteriophage sp.]
MLQRANNSASVFAFFVYKIYSTRRSLVIFFINF